MKTAVKRKNIDIGQMINGSDPLPPGKPKLPVKKDDENDTTRPIPDSNEPKKIDPVRIEEPDRKDLPKIV